MSAVQVHGVFKQFHLTVARRVHIFQMWGYKCYDQIMKFKTHHDVPLGIHYIRVLCNYFDSWYNASYIRMNDNVDTIENFGRNKILFVYSQKRMKI